MAQDVDAAPASATEIVPGTGGLTRRQLRELRAAQNAESARPVPLQVPTPQSPQSSDRTVADVLGTVAAIEDQKDSDDPHRTVLDAAAIEQATEADGSPNAVEPLADAVAHSEEPRRHRSTWSPAPNAPGAQDAVPDHDPSAETDPDAVEDTIVPGSAAAESVVPGLPLRAPLPNPTAAGVFPLDLDADTDEVPVAARSASTTGASTTGASASDATNEPGQPERADAPAAGTRGTTPAEPKPVTTAFAAPAGHWSRQAAEDDAHVHDPETGAVRETQPVTNALIMPNSALSDVTGALNATGEVIITGSIDLPKALASTGSHTPIDGAEVDRLLEQQDADGPSSDASPVRASRAVSSHTSTRAVVLAAAMPKQSRLPTVLAYGAAGLGVVGVAALVIAAVTLHLF
ncbi:hypothetical protein [Curtobacterium sp. RRHDQ10]|uniref:hypothetical protein n=1 Tax=Curtobacterium phyllosphaerae TaxID=3413379 RepID=UPI003BEFB2C0